MKYFFIIFLKVLFFISFALYFISKDKMLWKCKSVYGRALIILHHLITPLILFLGILFQLYYLNLFLVIMTVLSWLLLNQCLISTMSNNLCGFDEKTQFMNIGTLLRNYIGKKLNINIHLKWELVILFIILGYNVFMIQKSG